jgi:replicative superfamily II helicase
MNLRADALERLESHWAVSAIDTGERNRATKLAENSLVGSAVGRQLNLRIDLNIGEVELLQRLALAYEMAAIEGLPAFINLNPEHDDLRFQCAAGAWRTFELLRLLPVPQETDERIFHVLHVAGLAYCGDRWSDIRRWFGENPNTAEIPSVAGKSWHLRVLYRLFECWIRLFRKNGWDDLHGISEIIAGLRTDQREHEKTSLNNGSNAEDRAMALHLITLYNWAKGTELLAQYMLQGEPRGIPALLDKHFDTAKNAAAACGNNNLEVLMRWLHAAARQMVSGSLWWVAQNVNGRTTPFIASITQSRAMFELLPPQQVALQEQGLLDAAATAVVVDLPTSGGKTLLAEFRILQALNQFSDKNGWVAYVVPTKTLGNQITRRMRRDFGPINVRVEQLTGAVEIDAIEKEILESNAGGEERAFDILVATPEKLQLVIRNKRVSRPLALIVMDEAHNMESEGRGIRIELLLATIKQESIGTKFLLLMPFVENTQALARWLADNPNAGRSISLGTTPWKPNEQVVGMFRASADGCGRSEWKLEFETLLTTRNTLHLSGTHQVGDIKPLALPKSDFLQADGQQKGFNLQAAAMSSIFASRGTSIAVGDKTKNVWSMAREVYKKRKSICAETNSERIDLVQKYLSAEISPEFELRKMLSYGVAVHHSGLSDEVRSLIEWLTEEGDIKVLCTTTTIAQGINFPVSSVFLASNKYPYGIPFKKREFWNLAGRAGRMNQDSVGVVGIADGNRPAEIQRYVHDAVGELVSQLVTIVSELDSVQTDDDIIGVLNHEQWEDYRCYVGHLVHEIGEINRVIAGVENSLRNTYGFRKLQESADGRMRAEKLIQATKVYARKISANPGQVAMADMTGFSYEGAGRALMGIRTLERNLTPGDFSVNQLFGNAGGMSDLYGIMLKIPQLAKSLDEIKSDGNELRHLANITNDWVNGRSIQEIATAYFKKGNMDITDAISKACKAIYRNLINNGTWGLSAISRLGIKFDQLSEEQQRHINLLPAMIYHGVKSEEGVLMRMSGVPRSIAENLGKCYKESAQTSSIAPNVRAVRQFVTAADIEVWDRSRPQNSPLTAKDYKDIWGIISGEGR